MGYAPSVPRITRVYALLVGDPGGGGGRARSLYATPPPGF